jgi:parafibromin
MDPDQGLMTYRNACKQYNVNDPVKALDKPTIVGFFLGITVESVAVAAAAVTAPVPPAREEKKKSKQRKEKDREHSSSRDKNKHAREHEHDRKKKKAKTDVTTEQLFSNLSEVVDKRKIEQNVKEEITKALSAEGFQVTPQMLEDNKETTQAILANEIPVGNSTSILRALNPEKNLSRVLELYDETVKRKKKPAAPPPTARKKLYLVGKKPVIVVPKGMTAPITLVNAHEFLCNGHFVPRDVLIKQGLRGTTTFTRTVRNNNTTGLLEYEIMDNPKKLGPNPKEWERVVAVIALGQSWQFKDWPAPLNDPVVLFTKTFGFYVSMEGEKISEEVKGWAVTQARLNRDKRGLDKVAYATFWNRLDEWMAIHKSELLPQQES